MIQIPVGLSKKKEIELCGEGACKVYGQGATLFCLI